MHRLTIPLLVCLTAFVVGMACSAEEPAGTPANVQELLRKLASPDYRARESAAAQLVKLGDNVRDALQEELKNPQADTRLQVERILAEIKQSDLQRQIDEFLISTEPEAGNNLPGWTQLRDVIGDGDPERRFYVEMLNSEGDLLNATSQNPRTAASAFHLRCQQLQIESSTQSREIDRPSLATVLFVAANDAVPLVPGTDSLLYRFCSHSSVENVLQAEDALRVEDDVSIMRKIVGAWITSGRGGYYSLRLAMKHELPEGLDAAEKMLDGETPAYYRQYAILTYAKLGDKSSIPRLAKMLGDATVCTTHRVNDEMYQTQFRDIALVAILHLAGHDPKKFGFERIRPHSEYVYSPYTLGFKDEQQREAAFAQWEKIKPQLKLTPANE